MTHVFIYAANSCGTNRRRTDPPNCELQYRHSLRHDGDVDNRADSYKQSCEGTHADRVLPQFPPPMISSACVRTFSSADGYLRGIGAP